MEIWKTLSGFSWENCFPMDAPAAKHLARCQVNLLTFRSGRGCKAGFLESLNSLKPGDSDTFLGMLRGQQGGVQGKPRAQVHKRALICCHKS